MIEDHELSLYSFDFRCDFFKLALSDIVFSRGRTARASHHSRRITTGRSDQLNKLTKVGLVSTTVNSNLDEHSAFATTVEFKEHRLSLRVLLQRADGRY